MKRVFKLFFTFISLVLVLGSITSCALLFPSSRIEDLENIRAFHSITSSKSPNLLAVDKEGKGGANVDLYIDYSDCMITAVNSAYYKKVQPAIIACSPNYYSVKGNEIKLESSDKMKIYQLLNSITNVDYSDIKGAVDKIINNKREAILITDGEYYQQGIGPNLTNPYLADEFKQWLSMGLDVYIYSEPYTFANVMKNRYYMLFTDHRIENNIYEIFSRNAPKQDDVKMVHLYSGIPSVQVNNTGVVFNEQLLITEDCQVNPAMAYECHTMDAKWDDVYDYILNATDENGNAIKGGEFFIKGLSINVTEEDAYKPSEIDLKCYEISDVYSEFEPKKKNAKLPSTLDKMFVLDKSAWEKGNVVIKLDPEFDGSCLEGSLGNLLRIDICVKTSRENFTTNEEIGGKFKFNSPWGFNSSVYESLKQTLLDPSISPEKMGNPIIYTVYLSTFSK